ncbi:MAG TPA: sugar phosphate nucleotidyltransferase [Gammaproteobacteria bacterium]
MDAVILAGGRGRRLAPYTVCFPKPLVPVGQMPILEIVLRQLAAAGCRRATLAVGYLAELIIAYFGDGKQLGLEIRYSREDEPLGTVGPLTLLDGLPEHFLVMNGDVLTTLDYAALFAAHKASGAELTIACYRCQNHVDLGVVEFDGQLRVTGYREKPTVQYDASMGIYVFRRSALDLVEPGTYRDFPDLVQSMLLHHRPVKAHIVDCLWLDVGRRDDYERAIDLVERNPNLFYPENAHAASGPEVRAAS